MSTSTFLFTIIVAALFTVAAASLQGVIFPAHVKAAKPVSSVDVDDTMYEMMNDRSSCEDILRLFAYDEEIVAGEEINDETGQNTFNYPVYDADTKIPLGSYTGYSTTIGNDCVGNGVFNLDWNEEKQSYDSQIFVSVSCSGSFNGIVGGTGQYAFIKNGHEKFVAHSAGSVSELHFTSPECQPPVMMMGRRNSNVSSQIRR